MGKQSKEIIWLAIAKVVAFFGKPSWLLGIGFSWVFIFFNLEAFTGIDSGLDISLILQAAKALEFCRTEPCSPTNTCACPTSRWKKSPELATKTSVVWWKGELTCLKQSPRATSHRILWSAGRWHGGSLSAREEGEIASYKRIDIRLTHQLLGKPAEGHAPYHPFDKSSH